jgi:beta-mannanase
LLPEAELAPDRLAIGVYDPFQWYAREGFQIEQWYIRQTEPELLAAALDHARGHRVPLVTVEPWPRSRRWAPVLEWVVNGRMDDDLRQLARVVRDRAPQIVLLRWGHEMDLSGLYPWSANDPGLYRAAFRHVVSVFRTEGATNARWVWSPAGEQGAAAFYPGDDVVDEVGLTVLGDAGWDGQLGFTTRRTLADLLQPAYAEVASLRKPIVLAEVGVSGTPDEQAAWLADGLAVMRSDFPLVRAVVYFNDRNAPNNRLSTQPDWRLPPDAAAPLLASATS